MTPKPRHGLTEQAADAAVDQACRMLRLPTIRAQFPDLAEAAAREQMSYRGFLAELLMAECDDRRELVTSIVAPFGPWEPAQPSEAAAIFSAMPCPWWIAGGYAIELAHIGRISSDGIQYLAPEIQLFYKAKNPRQKDGNDFTAVLPFLAEAQRRWLSDALTRTFGEHPWRDWLSRAPAAGPELPWTSRPGITRHQRQARSFLTNIDHGSALQRGQNSRTSTATSREQNHRV